MSQRITLNDAKLGEVVDTDIVERPAIVNDAGAVIMSTPEMVDFPVDQLKLMAKYMKGRLVWRKYAVTYEEVLSTTTNSHMFCDYRTCYALPVEGSDYCGDKHKTLAGM